MYENFVERHSFRTFSGDSPKTIRKLCPSTKFPYQEIRWKHVILHNLTYYCQENLARDSFSVSDISSEINLNSADESAVVDHAISKNRIILPRYIVKLCGSLEIIWSAETMTLGPFKSASMGVLSLCFFWVLSLSYVIVVEFLDLTRMNWSLLAMLVYI